MNASDSKSRYVQQSRNNLRGGSSVSLVVAVRDQAEALKRLIASIYHQSKKPDEVIFVDAGSRDETVELLRRICAENATFRLIEARKALPSYARNIGVANANFDWIAFTDPSQRLEPGWLARLIEMAESDPETGVGRELALRRGHSSGVAGAGRGGAPPRGRTARRSAGRQPGRFTCRR